MTEELQETTSQTEQLDEQIKNEDSENIKAQVEEKLETKIDATNQEKVQKNDLKEELKAYQSLLNAGFITPQQGQNLLNYIIKKAFDDKVQQNEEINEPESCSLNDDKAILEFNKENSEFFNAEGRLEVTNYLKENGIQVDKDELSKISKIVEQVEKTAIERYLKKVAHEEVIEKSNAQAKLKLQANAQKTSSAGKNFSTFTREQIGKMTSAEFLKNESQIMEQLRKGLIK